MATTKKWGGIFLATIVLASAMFLLFSGRSSAEVPLADQTLLSAATNLHPVKVFSINRDASSIKEAFELAGVDYHPEDRVSYFPEPSLGLGTVVTVQRALPVTVRDGVMSRVMRSWASTVGGLIKEKKIILGDDDRVAPTLQTVLTLDTVVTITRVARTTISETETVPYQTIVQKDYYQFSGSQIVVTAGRNGQIKETYLVIRENGILVSKTLQSTKTLSFPVSAVVKQGGLDPVPSHCLVLKDWVVDASISNGIDPNGLYYRIIRESNCHPDSQAAAGYQGLLQYDPGWWPTASSEAGYAGASIWDARSQIYVTAWEWAHGNRSRWP